MLCGSDGLVPRDDGSRAVAPVLCFSSHSAALHGLTLSSLFLLDRAVALYPTRLTVPGEEAFPGYFRSFW